MDGLTLLTDKEVFNSILQFVKQFGGLTVVKRYVLPSDATPAKKYVQMLAELFRDTALNV